MRIKCLNCGRSEEVTLDLFAKILGVATAGFGYWAWVSFLFAGTGFAMALCIAIMAGGAAMLVFKDEIVDWIVNQGYECEGCGSKGWTAISPELEKEINAKETKQRATPDEMPKSILDCFEALGLTQGVSPDQVKNRYKTLMKQYHPDKVATLGAELQELARKKAARFNTAYAILKKNGFAE